MRLYQRHDFKANPNYAGGFSLIELIIVISLIGILAISLSNLTKNAIYGYIDAKDRNQFSQSAKFVIEKMSRELREALPQSIRVSDDGDTYCVEFMAIANASTYLDLPRNGPVSSFTAVGYNLSSTTATEMVVMPLNPNSVYSNVASPNNNIASITDLTGADAGKVSVSFNTPYPNFVRRSPQNRFYILSQPVSFCLQNSTGQINRYNNYTATASQSTPPSGNADLMGENFSTTGNVFSYQSGTLTRTGLVQIFLRIQNNQRSIGVNEEALTFFQEVHIRNVP
jgi:MSHA biogenesis protein MshO